MSKELKPSNQNKSLSDVMANPMRDEARAVIGEALIVLQEKNTPTSVQADVMFDYLKILMEPVELYTPQKAAGWYMQLERFSDHFQGCLKELDDVCIEDHD